MHEEHPQGPFCDIPVEDAKPESDLEETPDKVKLRCGLQCNRPAIFKSAKITEN